uniref:CSON003753 protein n=1 Tax=Culicoides sonorensis TaxID=179676 RepID=A0A336MQU5_CULSO
MIHGILLLLAVCAILYSYIKWCYNYWARHGIKYSEPSFPYGTLILGKELHWGEIALRDYLKYKSYGPIYGGFTFTNPMVYINDKELAKNILVKDFNVFYDRGIYSNPHDDPLNEHLFSLGGPKWQKLRQKLTPVFTSGKIKNMLPMLLKVGHNMVDTLKDEIKIDKTLDMKEWVARFTTDVIGTCAFGLECNSLKDPNAEFRVMGRKSFTDINMFSAFICVNFPKLALKLGLGFTPRPVTKFFIKVVEDTIEYREKNNITRNDFMDLLIKMRNKDKSNDPEKDQELEGFSVYEIAAQAFVFFLAGFETSSTVVSYTLLELAMNQEIQDKVRTEINQVLKKYDNEITYDAIQEMTYLEQCINACFECTLIHVIIASLIYFGSSCDILSESYILYSDFTKK